MAHSVARWALRIVLCAAVMGFVLGAESAVGSGMGHIVLSCSPLLLLAAFVALGASWCRQRAPSWRAAAASFDESLGREPVEFLEGAASPGAAVLTALVVLAMLTSIQVPLALSLPVLGLSLAAGALGRGRANLIVPFAVPVLALVTMLPSFHASPGPAMRHGYHALVMLTGACATAACMQLAARTLERRPSAGRTLAALAGASAAAGSAFLLHRLGAPTSVALTLLTLLLAPSLCRRGRALLFAPSAVAAVALALHAHAGFWALFLVLAAACVLFAIDWMRRLEAPMESHGAALDAIPENRLGPWIALAACAGLVLELVLVRWQSSCFQLFAFFKNVTLFAAFLGLGMGYAVRASKPLMLALVLPALSLQVVIFHGLRFSQLQPTLQNPVPEHVAFGMVGDGSLAKVVVTYAFLLLTFAATVMTCLPLGQLAARLMRRGDPLRAYGWNLAGSLGGVLLFALLAHLWSPPASWLLVVGLLLAPFFALGRGATLGVPSALSLGAALMVLLQPGDVDSLEVHSPYQVLVLDHPPQRPPVLSVNNVYFQNILDLRPESVASSQELRNAAAHYALPHRLRSHPGSVLVVGSGTGNDVAAALRAGATKVDAVEIDPGVLRFGELHPEQPYRDPRVHAILDDARHHLRQTTEYYDLIVYGLLDSHTLLSGLSNVRLDSFVYTVEAFRDARARLTPDGIVSLSFCVVTDAIARKLFLMLKEAFDGVAPRVFATKYDFGMCFAVGPGLRRDVALPEIDDITARVRGLTVRVDLSTDDWPFLYMGSRQVPRSYVLMAVGVLVLSALLVWWGLPEARALGAPAFFFLGAGFMLIEAKAITELALVFGSTWQVTSAVIAAVLIMAFLSNMVVSRLRPARSVPAYALLGLAIAAGMLVPVSVYAGLAPVAGKALAAAHLTLPLLFAGFIFSTELRRSVDLSAALGSNLVGAMAGGLLEYNSLRFGFNALGAVALALYAAALVSSLRRAG